MGIGLGGISEGWLPAVLLYQQTGVLKLTRILLVDGKMFADHNRSRQYFRTARNKAEERKAVWSAVYPDTPLYSVAMFVDRQNVGQLVRDESVVLVSPDNHPTRVLISDYVEALDNVLLIAGGNDAITTTGGQSGTQGWATVHCRVGGHTVTPPVTRYHEDLRRSEEKLPTEMSCVELAQAGQPQLLATNLFVGQVMGWLLHRYLTQPLHQAMEVVEVCINSATGDVGQYGIHERYLGTVFDRDGGGV